MYITCFQNNFQVDHIIDQPIVYNHMQFTVPCMQMIANSLLKISHMIASVHT